VPPAVRVLRKIKSDMMDTFVLRSTNAYLRDKCTRGTYNRLIIKASFVVNPNSERAVRESTEGVEPASSPHQLCCWGCSSNRYYQRVIPGDKLRRKEHPQALDMVVCRHLSISRRGHNGGRGGGCMSRKSSSSSSSSIHSRTSGVRENNKSLNPLKSHSSGLPSFVSWQHTAAPWRWGQGLGLARVFLWCEYSGREDPRQATRPLEPCRQKN